MKISTVLASWLGLLTAFPSTKPSGIEKLTSCKLYQLLTNSVSSFHHLTGKNFLHIRHGPQTSYIVILGNSQSSGILL